MSMLRCEPLMKTCRKTDGRETDRAETRTETVSAGIIASAPEETLSAWYDAYGTDILRYCFMFLGNRADAEDATQETFLKVWRNIGRYKALNGCSPKTWIIRIAGNTCRDYLRRGWRKHENRLITPEELKRLGNAPEEDRELIMDVMKLPDKYREVVLLVFWYGMTIREAAECMCTSQSTAFRTLEKAKKMIA